MTPVSNPGGGSGGVDETAFNNLVDQVLALDESVFAHGQAIHGGQAGLWAMPFSWGLPATITLVANQLAGMRFMPARDLTVASIGFEVSTAIAGADLYVAIYDAALGRLAMSAEQVDMGATTGIKSVPLALALEGGTDYYAAIVSNANPTIRGMNMANQNSHIRFGSTAGLVDVFLDNSAYPPPATAAIDQAGISGGIFPVVTVHE